MAARGAKKVQAEPTAQPITTALVTKYLKLKALADQRRKALEAVDGERKELELHLIGAIDAGADLSHCRYAISISTREERRSSWKEEFIKSLGEKAADLVIKATPVSIYRRLAVTDPKKVA